MQHLKHLSLDLPAMNDVNGRRVYHFENLKRRFMSGKTKEQSMSLVNEYCSEIAEIYNRAIKKAQKKFIMKAIEFPDVNIRIAENQPEYETVPANITPDEETEGYFNNITMCFELDEEERRQVVETGRIWQTILVPSDSKFHPIKMSCLKPEGFTPPEPDQQKNAEIFMRKLRNEKGQVLAPGKIASGRLVDEEQYRQIEHGFFHKHGRKPSDIEMYEQCLSHEKEWLTKSILLKVPELIQFRAETKAPCEVAIYAELDVLIPEDLG